MSSLLQCFDEGPNDAPPPHRDFQTHCGVKFTILYDVEGINEPRIIGLNLNHKSIMYKTA